MSNFKCKLCILEMNNYVNEPELNASSNEYIPTPIMPKVFTSINSEKLILKFS